MYNHLTRVSEALKLILGQAPSVNSETATLYGAFGRISAVDIFSPLDHPHFDNSAVDGYGIRVHDLQDNDGMKFEIVGEIKAGDNKKISLKKNEAVRIFTGASVPACVDAVVMQEKVRLHTPFIEFSQNGLAKGSNIRRKGEQIKKGEIALKKGAVLHPAEIGFLASLGISKVKVARPPKVAVIVTGNEIVRQEKKLKIGQIYESNGIMLKAALRQMNIAPSIYYCKDDLNAMKKMFREEEKKNDILIVTGGVSVGDYDFTTAATSESGFEILIHGIQQKPGKPFLFSKKKKTFLFGLPGNPRAVLTCFYEYLFPFINSMTGASEISLKKILLPLSCSFRKKADGKTHFVTGKITEGRVKILGGQDSHLLRSFAEADVLVTLPADKEFFSENEIITTHLLSP